MNKKKSVSPAQTARRQREMRFLSAARTAGRLAAQQRQLQNEWADNYELNHKSANEAFEILAEKI